MRKTLEVLFFFAVVSIIISAVMFMQDQGALGATAIVEKIASKGMPAIPFSSQNEDAGSPFEFPDEESEDEDDQAKEPEGPPGANVGRMSNSIAALQLLYKEHHRKVTSPPPQS